MILALEGLTLIIEVTLRSQYHRLRITFVLLETFQYRKYSADNFSRFTQRIRHIVIYSMENLWLLGYRHPHVVILRIN